MRDVVRIHPRADRGPRLADDAVGTADYPAPWPAADHPNPAVAPGPFAQDLRGPIGGTVVQNDELEVAEALADDTLNAGLQVVLAVVDWHHDAEGEAISGEQTRGSWEKSCLRTVFNGMQANPVLAIPRSTREGGAGPGRFPRFSGPAPCAILSGNPSSEGARRWPDGTSRTAPTGSSSAASGESTVSKRSCAACAPSPECAGPRRSRSSTGRRSSRATTFTRKTAWARPCSRAPRGRARPARVSCRGRTSRPPWPGERARSGSGAPGRPTSTGGCWPTRRTGRAPPRGAGGPPAGGLRPAAVGRRGGPAGPRHGAPAPGQTGGDALGTFLPRPAQTHGQRADAHAGGDARHLHAGHPPGEPVRPAPPLRGRGVLRRRRNRLRPPLGL